ncbi:deoxynucleotide monophosphate kinase [Ralstonia solanacearum]|uniref:deoxynucleotide monophosphate kinase family protein n=1 Tax=Ralstonia solanacearum TaxID=305 RepID=UPI001FFB64B2|nr:deoxynucleotide monophosphate kinase [Ralstonia solanacearum]MDB0554334.1 deoxynucleotide monophosphate kinase [Ralstonia solanacearum]
MLIGITGRAQVGKDTAAAHLRAAHGFRQIAFADPLRAMLQAGFGLTVKDFEPGRKEELLPLIGKSPRQLMQSMGTEWGRLLVSPDVWVTLAEGRIRAELFAGHSVVVSDVRMENEADMIRRAGGVILHLHRAAAGRVAEHSSEHGIDFAHGDIEMFNNGRPADLLGQLDDYVSEVTTALGAVEP